jgi:hypothetical protein
MAKSSPEKLARALRANLQRRKQAKGAETGHPPADSTPKLGKKLPDPPSKS